MTRNLLNTINIDVPAAAVEETVAFWSAALGASPLQTKMPQYTILESAADPNRLVIQAIEEGSAGVHFDIHTDDLDAEIERLVALGATLVDDQWKEHPGRWVILRDPAGNEFCLVDGTNPLRGSRVLEDFDRRARAVGGTDATRGTEAMKPAVEDIVELSHLCATYASRMTQGDIGYVIEHLMTPDGTYSAFGEVYGLEDWPALVEAAPKGLFLCGDPELEVDGDTGTGRVPLLFIDQTNHRMRMGWYSDTYRRTDDGWRLATRKMTFLRRDGSVDSGNPHDPRRPKPGGAAVSS